MIWDYIQQGGAVMYLLLALNIIGVSIMLSKAYIFITKGMDVAEVSQQIYETVKGEEKDYVMELAKKEIEQHIGTIETGMNTVKIIATIAPLLGLLGTVIGVFMAFKIMAESGMGSPEKFAEGISVALITTVGGMIVAILHYVGHNYLLAMVDKIEAKIEKAVITKLSEAA
jgi:biopolymer transport protein ExbB